MAHMGTMDTGVTVIDIAAQWSVIPKKRRATCNLYDLRFAQESCWSFMAPGMRLCHWMSVSWHFEDHYTFTCKINSFTIQYQTMHLFRETSTPQTPLILSPFGSPTSQDTHLSYPHTYWVRPLVLSHAFFDCLPDDEGKLILPSVKNLLTQRKRHIPQQFKLQDVLCLQLWTIKLLSLNKDLIARPCPHKLHTATDEFNYRLLLDSKFLFSDININRMWWPDVCAIRRQAF